MIRQFLLVAALALPVAGEGGGTLRLCLRSEPRSLHPLEAAEESSETVRYLTAGVLVRINRQTQRAEPELARSWKITDGGRRITFQLREGIQFSDGSPFGAQDVVYTFAELASDELRSPAADAFRTAPGRVSAKALSEASVTILLPAPVAGLERLFDAVAILPRAGRSLDRSVLGPFRISQHQPGSFILLERNPHYWKKDSSGRKLPYLDAVRLDIQQNREIEMLRFRRGEIHMINKLDPELFERLAAEEPGSAFNAGPSMEPEQMWFNQANGSPLPEYKRAWFGSRNFRNAISHSIRRQDLARIAFLGRAAAAAGPVSEANQYWFNRQLKPRQHDPKLAKRLLVSDGFRWQGSKLVDRGGHPVQFSIITNSGNKTRAKMAALIQQDLGEIGIDVRITPLDFPSLIERISRTFQYDACLLGLVNVDLDPNGQMNVWLSSSGNHQWNPNQKSPATAWEAEIDHLMRSQAATLDPERRKKHFDKVQRIVWEQEPFLYLVYKNALAAAAPSLRNFKPVAMFPQGFWNADQIVVSSTVAQSRR
ncbi:MAG: ABC transporter substrate-binding protein [Acidobacteriia bacterium]|nr:ABC transporter substrate-binding protein [Terriglobia bacterium]